MSVITTHYTCIRIAIVNDLIEKFRLTMFNPLDIRNQYESLESFAALTKRKPFPLNSWKKTSQNGFGVRFYQVFTVAGGNISNGTIDDICIEPRTTNFDYTGKTAVAKSNGKKYSQ